MKCPDAVIAHYGLQAIFSRVFTFPGTGVIMVCREHDLELRSLPISMIKEYQHVFKVVHGDPKSLMDTINLARTVWAICNGSGLLMRGTLDDPKLFDRIDETLALSSNQV